MNFIKTIGWKTAAICCDNHYRRFSDPYMKKGAVEKPN
jgi:hypothetical protein